MSDRIADLKEVLILDAKIIQILPAPVGVYGVTLDDCGNRKEVPLLAVGLTEVGGIEFLYIVDGQRIDRAKEVADHRGR